MGKSSQVECHICHLIIGEARNKREAWKVIEEHQLKDHNIVILKNIGFRNED